MQCTAPSCHVPAKQQGTRAYQVWTDDAATTQNTYYTYAQLLLHLYCMQQYCVHVNGSCTCNPTCVQHRQCYIHRTEVWHYVRMCVCSKRTHSFTTNTSKHMYVSCKVSEAHTHAPSRQHAAICRRFQMTHSQKCRKH